MQPEVPIATPSPQPTRAGPSAASRGLLVLTLVLGLLTVGGAAVVSAASPDASSPTATQDASGADRSTDGDTGADVEQGTTEGRGGHDCPDDDASGDGSTDGSTDDGSDTPTDQTSA